MYVFNVYYEDGSLRASDRVTLDVTPKMAFAMMWRKYPTAGSISWIATETR